MAKIRVIVESGEPRLD